MKSKVAIIVPIYNSKDTIIRCVDSIKKQSLDDISIILVDDGSTDESYELCKKMSRRDERIMVLHQSNAGVSAARNYGIKNADSEYIMFVDSDDFIEKDICKNLYEFVEKNKCEIGIVNKIFYKDSKKIKNTLYNGNEIIREGMEKDLFSLDLFSYYFDERMNKVQYLSCGVTAKLFSRKLVEKNNILFFEDCSFGEDVLFNLYAFEYANKIGYLNYDGYDFIVSLNSTTHKFKEKWLSDHEKLIEKIDDFIIKFKKDSRFVDSSYMMKATRISGLASSYFFHYDNKKNFLKKYNDYKKFVSKDIYKDAVKKVNFNMLTQNQKIIIKLEQYRCSLMVAIISSIKNGKEKIKKCRKNQ